MAAGQPTDAHHPAPTSTTDAVVDEGGTVMAFLSLLSAVFVITFEQLVQWHYGPAGIIGLLLLTIGVKARNATCGSIGGVLLAIMVAGPALH
jgi:hypothetical protein